MYRKLLKCFIRTKFISIVEKTANLYHLFKYKKKQMLKDLSTVAIIIFELTMFVRIVLTLSTLHFFIMCNWFLIKNLNPVCRCRIPSGLAMVAIFNRVWNFQDLEKLVFFYFRLTSTSTINYFAFLRFA